MKTKRVSVLLSLLTLLQLVFIGVGGSIVNELFRETLNVRFIVILALAIVIVAIIGTILYWNLFIKTKPRK